MLVVRSVGHAIDFESVAARDRIHRDELERSRFVGERGVPFFTVSVSLAQSAWVLGRPPSAVVGHWRDALTDLFFPRRHRSGPELLTFVTLAHLVGTDDERIRALSFGEASTEPEVALSWAWFSALSEDSRATLSFATEARKRASRIECATRRGAISVLGALFEAFAMRDSHAFTRAWRFRERSMAPLLAGQEARTWVEGVLDPVRIALARQGARVDFVPPTEPSRYVPQELVDLG
ncbi:MAG: hypothetical protein U0169_05750 [Polyangiaceae bacterium]